ncbi:hypothetical protein DMH27_16025 [Raoultella planticola]|nr:hypothetical protein [Raoultella planticola]
MDSGYHIRLTEHQQIVIAFQIAWPVGKAFAAEVLFTQTIAPIMVPMPHPEPKYVFLTADAVVQLCCSHSLPTTLNQTEKTQRTILA